MPSHTTKEEKRYFTIEDDGDSFHVHLFDGGMQVASCFIPDDGSGLSFDIALQIGNSYGEQSRSLHV